MLAIRPEQMKVFEDAAMRRFEDEMVPHLRRLAPKHCNAVGEEGLRQVVRKGGGRAASYGLTNRGPVRFYLDLMIMLGSDFDTDPQYPWVLEILKDSGIPDQMDRAERLHEKIMDYSAKVFGQDYVMEKAAVHRVAAVKYEELPSSAEASARELAMHFEKIFPEKIQYIGRPPISALTARARTLSEQYRLAPDRGPIVLTGLMFTFGHGAATDPQFPWIADTLGKDIQNAVIRTEQLFHRTMAYLGVGEAK